MLKTLTQYRSTWITQVCLYDWCDRTNTVAHGALSTGMQCRGCYNEQQCRSCRSGSDDSNDAAAAAIEAKCCILSRDNVALQLWCVDVSDRNITVSFHL